MLQTRISRKSSVCLLICSYLIWLFILYNFVSGYTPVNIDSYYNYAILKYFFNNLLDGIIPLWDPFLYMGRHFLYSGFSTALSPFALLIPILHFIGLDYYHSYIIYICSYYFLGLVGFYFLASKILKSTFLGLIAFELLLFSGMGGMLFNQVLIIYMFVPCVWFFLFFLHFIERFELKHFWGMTFTLMLMNISYLPFYFFIVFLIVVASAIFAYRQNTVVVFTSLIKFLKTHLVAVGVAFVLISTCTVPLIIFKLIDKQGEFISPARHNCSANQDIETCMTEAKMNFSEVGYSGTLGERTKGGRLFSNLDKFSFFSDEMPYIPVTAYLLILISALTIIDRNRLIMIFTVFSILIISYGGATPVSKWLFDHIFLFQYFRNYFFFIAFLIPLVILFAVAQFKAFLLQAGNSQKERKIIAIYLVLAHGGFLFLLKTHDDILWSTYLSVILSAILSVTFILGSLKVSSKTTLLTLALLLTLEPVCVFNAYSTNASLVHTRVTGEHHSPQFEYTRPDENLSNKDLHWRINSGYPLLIHMMALKDSNGHLVSQVDSVLKEAYLLNLDRPWNSLSKYTKHKILIYDHVDVVNISQENRRALEDTITPDRHAALVTSPDPRFQQLSAVAKNPPLIVDHDSDLFKVQKFNVNEITFKTSFQEPKFLVYNDSYSKNWEVAVNGQKDILYKANMAFKGVFLPAGHNIVAMTYSPVGGTLVYLIIMLSLLLLLLYLIYLFLKCRHATELDQDSRDDNTITMRSYLIYILFGSLVLMGVNTLITQSLRSKYLGYNTYLLAEDSPIDAILYYDYMKYSDPARAKIYQTEIERNYLLLDKKLKDQKESKR